MSSEPVASAGNYMPINIPQLSDYNLSPAKLYGFQIMAANSKGNLILRAPTDSGKTEAALLWAQLNQEKNGRLFYALPTTASVNAMYLRINHLFQDTEDRLIGLLHSRAISTLYSMFEGENSSDVKANQKAVRTIGSLVKEMYFPLEYVHLTKYCTIPYEVKGGRPCSRNFHIASLCLTRYMPTILS
jgi:CRISPR-associated endonuclease/helicase Cas3